MQCYHHHKSGTINNVCKWRGLCVSLIGEMSVYAMMQHCLCYDATLCFSFFYVLNLGAAAVCIRLFIFPVLMYAQLSSGMSCSGMSCSAQLRYVVLSSSVWCSVMWCSSVWHVIILCCCLFVCFSNVCRCEVFAFLMCVVHWYKLFASRRSGRYCNFRLICGD